MPDLPPPTVDDVHITHELARRQSRPADHAAEIRAISQLADTLANDPGRVLQQLVETVMDLCHADSAGISVLEPGGEHGVIRWHAIAGQFVQNLMQTVPRELSPCGDVIARNRTLLLSTEAEKVYPPLRSAEPRIHESLTVPWSIDGQPVGTLWVLSHTSGRRFDAEDDRLVKSLARFAAAAWQTVLALRSAEAAQRTSEGRYRALFEAMDEGFFYAEAVFDRTGQCIDLVYREENPAAVRMTGQSFRGRHVSELGAYEPFWLQTFGRTAATGEAQRLEHFAAPDDKWYDCFVFKPAGAAQNDVAVIFQDATERKRREAHAALLDAVGQDLATLTTPDQLIQAVGQRVGESLSLDNLLLAEVRDPSGRATLHHAWSSGVMPHRLAEDGFGDYASNAALVEDSRAGIDFVVADTDDDPQVEAARFRELDIRSFVCTPYVSGGQWTGCVVAACARSRTWKASDLLLLREVSDRLFARVERSRAEQSLREADRRKDEFLATLAHEMRNPLAPIRQGLQVMRLNGAWTDNSASLVELMDRQVTHLVRLIDDLMEVSRVTRGKIDLRREVIDLAGVVRAAAETVDAKLRAAGCPLELRAPDEPVWVDADPVRLTQMFVNLLDNAAKYGSGGDRVTVTDTTSAGEATISCRDYGAGIPKDMLSRVFELFTQVDRRLGRAPAGLGIGLALVKSLVELQGGRVTANSEGVGRGSEFLVWLPLAQPVHRPEPASATVGAMAGSLSSQRILVVDDNRDAADSLRMLLVSLGADVDVVYDGPSALAAVRTQRPSALLLDLGMSGMDGFEVARALRQQPQYNGLRIVALTGWGQPADLQRTREAGFDGHLVKPVAAEQLIEQLRR